MIRVFSRLCQHICDELPDGDGAVHAGRLRVIRLRHHRLQALIVKIDKQRVDALQDAGDPAIMQIEKAQRAASGVGRAT